MWEGRCASGPWSAVDRGFYTVNGYRQWGTCIKDVTATAVSEGSGAGTDDRQRTVQFGTPPGVRLIPLRSRQAQRAPSSAATSGSRGSRIVARQKLQVFVIGVGASTPLARDLVKYGELVLAANALHQDAVGVAEQADAQRQPSRVRKLSSGMCQGFYIVTDLLGSVAEKGEKPL